MIARLFWSVALPLVLMAGLAQISVPPRVLVRDEGTDQSSINTVDCLGSSVTCTASGAVWSLTVTGGGALGSYTALVLNTAGTDSAYGGTVCSNTFPRSLSGLGAANCSSVSLATDTSGTLAFGSGGTGLAAATGDTVMVSSGTAWIAEAMPNCGEAGTLNYATATNTFSCLTDGGGVGGGNFETAYLAFSAQQMDVLSTTTVNTTWVTATSVIVCAPQATDADGQTVENYYVTPFHITVSNLVGGASFDVTVLNPTGAGGTFRFGCTGA